MAAPLRAMYSLFKQAVVIPVLTIEKVEHAVPLAKALVAGGVRTLEVTLRTDAAIEAAKAIIAEVPDAVVGIGTILNPDDLARAKALGHTMVVLSGGEPTIRPELIEWADHVVSLDMDVGLVTNGLMLAYPELVERLVSWSRRGPV